MKIIIVVGARPNFMKAAPVIAAIQEHNRRILSTRQSKPAQTIQAILVHTGQHYGEAMSDSFFADLNLSKPDFQLGVGSGSHAVQTAEVMRRFEEVLLREKPDVVLVVGDVNSTLACALVTAKISFDTKGTRPLIGHVEAGLRSFDRTMPEEVNRVLTDHVCDLLFVTEDSAIRNLRLEGIQDQKVHFVGNTMIDSLLTFKDKADTSNILDTIGLRDAFNRGSNDRIARYAMLTLHRPSNVDNPETFLNILEGLDELSHSCPIVFPVHPRTQKQIIEFGLAHLFESNYRSNGSDSWSHAFASNRIRLLEPLGYLDFLCLMKHATLVVTDSGGIQEETTCLGVPCVTVRENTERPVTVTIGTNVLAGVRKESICAAVRRQLNCRAAHSLPEGWDGKSGARIVEVISRIRNNEQQSSRLDKEQVPQFALTAVSGKF